MCAGDARVLIFTVWLVALGHNGRYLQTLLDEHATFRTGRKARSVCWKFSAIYEPKRRWHTQGGDVLTAKPEYSLTLPCFICGLCLNAFMWYKLNTDNIRTYYTCMHPCINEVNCLLNDIICWAWWVRLVNTNCRNSWVVYATITQYHDTEIAVWSLVTGSVSPWNLTEIIRSVLLIIRHNLLKLRYWGILSRHSVIHD